MCSDMPSVFMTPGVTVLCGDSYFLFLGGWLARLFILTQRGKGKGHYGLSYFDFYFTNVIKV